MMPPGGANLLFDMFYRILSKQMSFIIVLAIAGAVSAQAPFEAYPAQYDRQAVTVPGVVVPPEAVETGLGGVVTVAVIVDAAGNVVTVEEAVGPGSVCRQIARADVVAMRAAAADAAKLVKFAPAAADGPALSRSWVRFEFPSSGKEAVHTAEPVKTETASVEQEKSLKDSIKFTAKGDGNYSAANVPPPDYKGPINTSGSATAGGSKTDKYTIIGDRNYSSAREPEYTETGKKISGGVLNGKAISLPKPPYPPAARAVRASGAVSIQVLIDTTGDVFSAHAVSGHPLLRSVSVTAACGARFAPTTLEGNPVKVSGVITYNFVP